MLRPGGRSKCVIITEDNSNKEELELNRCYLKGGGTIK